MFFDLVGEFDCEGGVGCGFAAWAVHGFFFVVWLARWRRSMSVVAMRSVSIFFSTIF